MKSAIQTYLEDHTARMENLLRYRKYFEEICAAIPDDWNVTSSVDSVGCVDIKFTGGKERLQEMWKILRAAGLEPDSHVGEEKVNSFSTYWRFGECSLIWMYWTSSVCRTVKVRTEMKEVPIYEVVCD